MATNDVSAIRALTQEEWDELNRSALERQNRAQSMRSARILPSESTLTTAAPGAKPETDVDRFTEATVLLNRFGTGDLTDRYLTSAAQQHDTPAQQQDSTAQQHNTAAAEGSERHLSLVPNSNSASHDSNSQHRNSQHRVDLSTEMTNESRWAEPVDWSECIEKDVQ